MSLNVDRAYINVFKPYTQLISLKRGTKLNKNIHKSYSEHNETYFCVSGNNKYSLQY